MTRYFCDYIQPGLLRGVVVALSVTMDVAVALSASREVVLSHISTVDMACSGEIERGCLVGLALSVDESVALTVAKAARGRRRGILTFGGCG